MSRDFDDISSIVLKPRRLQILRLLLSQGTMRISDLRKALNAPVSSIYYDVEILRANGLIIRDGPYVKITSKGRMIIERIDGLMGSGERTEDLGKRTEELTNILLMRPLTINMYRLGPNTLLIYSMVIIVLGLITAFFQNYELLLLVFVEGVNVMPVGITIISLLAYMGVALLIYRYLLGSEIVDARLLSGILTSLIPLSLYPTIMALLTPWLPPYPLSIVDALLKALLPLVSLVILATVLSMSSGKPMEYSLLFETLLLLIPSVIIYIILFK
ncbi:ArsR family transcriptional regulator [Vulcanisaeta sp. JCM 14467]|uniref:ArsR family transcriptional regulator n=1 Tax=Vulcanisaeta sp. JCM 14467 TaxID=1295370 RepID=UPI0006CF4BC5|nr:ArsR family transcriptional regulator [Vulcanisaeta sp. JCM 14467]